MTSFDITTMQKGQGPKVQRDLALLLQLLRLLETNWDTERKPTQIGTVQYTARFMEQIPELKLCKCTSCSSMMGSAATTAAIVVKHIRDFLRSDHTPECAQANIYFLLGEYLYTQQDDD